MPTHDELNRPVYWQYSYEVAPYDGTGGRTICIGDRCLISVEHARDTHILKNVVYNTYVAVIIVDVTKVGDLKLSSLSDYIGMVALASLKSDLPAVVVPSILSAFTDVAAGKPPQLGATPWDIGYLKGLYASSADVSAQAEQFEIYSRFERQMKDHPDATATQ